MSALDWGHAYERVQHETAASLRRERAEGISRHAFGDGGPCGLAPCDPTRMSDRQIDDKARLHAERVVQRGINQDARKVTHR